MAFSVRGKLRVRQWHEVEHSDVTEAAWTTLAVDVMSDAQARDAAICEAEALALAGYEGDRVAWAEGPYVADFEVVDVRGTPYRAWGYDWYIRDALALAPAAWSYEEVLRLRNAIRENYQHQLGLDKYLRGATGHAKRLRTFVQRVSAADRFATV